MTNKNPKVVIMMPGYNAARTVADTFKEIPPRFRKNVILVDDGSKDNTVAVSKKLGIKVFSHPNNLGYGGSQKTGYWEALKLNPDVVVMLHPDYQYDATMIPYLVQPILDGKFDYMFGSRISTKKGALKGGMPFYKYVLNRIVCFIQNILLGVNFSEHFSGYRAFSKKFLNTIPFQRFSNDFVFDQEMAISAISYDMNIGEIPIPTRYHEKQSSIKFLKGSKFLLEGFLTILKYNLHKLGLVEDRRFAPRKNKVGLSWGILGMLLLVLIYFIFPVRPVGIAASLFVLIQSVLIYLYFNSGDKGRMKIIIPLISLLVFGGFIISTGTFKGILTPSRLEQNQLWQRKEMYRRDLGKIGRNNFGNEVISKTKFYHDRIISRISNGLDLAGFFPSETPLLYVIVFLPLLIFGFFALLSNKLGTVLSYFAAASVSSIFVKPELAHILYLPLVYFAIFIGLTKLTSALKITK